jgi:hypothetical protein
MLARRPMSRAGAVLTSCCPRSACWAVRAAILADAG